MPPVVIGAAIVGAGAVASSAIASNAAKDAAEMQADAQQQQIDMQKQAAADQKVAQDQAVARKESAIANTPYPTYLSIPESQKYKQTLEDRMAGRGLIDVNAQTSPVANQVRAGLEQTNALTTAAASARGLGRSTVATSQIGANSQAAERDIADRVAQLELKRQDQIAQAVGQYGTLTEQEAGSQQNKAKYDTNQQFNVADTIAGNAQQNTQNQFDIGSTIATKGATDAAAELRQANILASGIAGLTKSAAQSSTDIIEAINKQQSQRGGRSSAQVNIATGRE